MWDEWVVVELGVLLRSFAVQNLAILYSNGMTDARVRRRSKSRSVRSPMSYSARRWVICRAEKTDGMAARSPKVVFFGELGVVAGEDGRVATARRVWRCHRGLI